MIIKIKPDEPRRTPTQPKIRKLINEPKATSEEREQALFVSWFKKNYKSVYILHIPNGGKRDAITANKMKVAGVSAGVPDLFIPAWKVFIEMKRSNGTIKDLSDAQKNWIDYLNDVGYTCYVGFGCDHAQKIIIEHEKGLNAITN